MFSVALKIPRYSPFTRLPSIIREPASRGDVSTIWSRVQNFVGDRQIRLHGGTDGDPTPTSISIGPRDFSGNFRKILLQELQKERVHFHHQQWLDAPEQGGLAQPLGCASESNCWLRDCRYLRYREYRFAIKARLNLLPVAAQKRKFGKPVSETRCGGCTGNIETLQHCLNVCTRNMPAMRARHNRIVDRLSEAIPGSLGTKYLDQTVLHCEGQGRPDIVILNEEAKKAYLVDVAIPWGSEENLKASRERKVEKYSGTKNCPEQKGFEVLLEGFLVGSLGTWDLENDSLLTKLGLLASTGSVQEAVCSRCHFGQLRCVGCPLPTWR